MSTRYYPTKVQISDDQMAHLDLLKHTTLPQWNYTLFPRTIRNCLFPRCSRVAGAPGLCVAHYQSARYLVIQGLVTWEQLVAQGKTPLSAGRRVIEALQAAEVKRNICGAGPLFTLRSK